MLIQITMSQIRPLQFKHNQMFYFHLNQMIKTQINDSPIYSFAFWLNFMCNQGFVSLFIWWMMKWLSKYFFFAIIFHWYCHSLTNSTICAMLSFIYVKRQTMAVRNCLTDEVDGMEGEIMHISIDRCDCRNVLSQPNQATSGCSSSKHVLRFFYKKFRKKSKKM